MRRNQWAGLCRSMSVVFSGAATVIAGCNHSSPPQTPAPPLPLVIGRAIDPATSTPQPVGSIPINMLLSPDGQYSVSTDQGFRQAIWSIRTSDGAGASHVDFPRTKANAKNGLYYGLAFAPDGTLYAAQGANDSIAVLKLDGNGNLSQASALKTRPGDFPAGLALDGKGRLYVANNDPAAARTVSFQTPGSIAIYDAGSGRELGRYEFTDSFGATPNFPLAIAALSDGGKLFVTSQRDGVVYVLDTSDPARPKLITRLTTGSHPIALLLDKSQSRLFVANAHSDTVSVVDTHSNQVAATVLLRPEIAKDVAGATPTGLALSPDEKTLYVTLGDMNAVAVVDSQSYMLLGYLPAGWYPTAVVATPDGKHLLVANAKGTVPRNPNPPAADAHQQSPIALLEGNVIRIELPPSQKLAAQTQRVLELDRLTPRYFKRDNPLRNIGFQAGGIKHVIYIVKENRTYDQVLGDLPQGNGDPNRCLFGRQVTPNQHALAERFVLLDNFYDCGEVSGDGWAWSTQGQANEYVIRNVPYSYSSRGRHYDYEGQVNEYPAGGFPAKGPDGKPLSQDPKYRNGGPAVPDVSEAPGGHIWDLVRRANLPYRNYGFFYSGGLKKGQQIIIPDNYPNSAGLQPAGHDLRGISDIDFLRFDLDYPDSDAPLRFAGQTKDAAFLRPLREYGIHRVPSRFSEWNAEFDQMLKRDPSGNAVPAFMTIRFCTDHTMGTNPNHHSPRSMVTDNDYAVGQLVEVISRSPIWKSTAIFIIEDDAQNGPDHVDAHRSTCYVISPWIKPHSVDRTFQNTASVLRTMELLLGLPPMCQYDATADPILDWDTQPTNADPYTAILPDAAVLREINGQSSPSEPISPEQRPVIRAMMEESSHMDFTHADRAPADRLNEIIWKSVKGPDSALPPTPHGPLPTVPPARQRDEDD